MTKEHFERTNTGHPIIFRVAYYRNREGSIDMDIVIADRLGRTKHPKDERYVMYMQRLDDGATVAGIYEHDFTVLVHRALRMSDIDGLRDAHERIIFRA